MGCQEKSCCARGIQLLAGAPPLPAWWLRVKRLGAAAVR